MCVRSGLAWSGGFAGKKEPILLEYASCRLSLSELVEQLRNRRRLVQQRHALAKWFVRLRGNQLLSRLCRHLGRQRKRIGDDATLSRPREGELRRLGHVLAKNESALDAIPEAGLTQRFLRGTPLGRMFRIRDGESRHTAHSQGGA